jgi:PIN domain nuclease of toxin-antitoxin system
MRSLLLDTHVLIWWLTAPKRLGRKTYAQIERADVAVSVIGLWEMLFKSERGKLKLPAGDLPALIEAQGFRILPLRIEHVRSAANLGGMHGDPSDRLIIGTALAERLVLVTGDAQIIERAAPALGDLLLEA